MMRLIEGGIRMPSVPPAARDPRNSRLIVVAPLDLRIGDGAHRRGRRDRGPRRGREDRAGADVRVHQAARQPGQPLGDGVVHALGDPGPQHDLSEEDEHRDRDKDELLALVPDEFADGRAQPPAEIQRVQAERQDAEYGRHRNGGNDQHHEGDDDPCGQGLSLPVRRRAVRRRPPCPCPGSRRRSPPRPWEPRQPSGQGRGRGAEGREASTRT